MMFINKAELKMYLHNVVVSDCNEYEAKSGKHKETGDVVRMMNVVDCRPPGVCCNFVVSRIGNGKLQFEPLILLYKNEHQLVLL